MMTMKVSARKWIILGSILFIIVAGLGAFFVMRNAEVARSLISYRHLSAVDEAVLTSYPMPRPPAVPAESLIREADLLCYGLTESEVQQAVRVEGVKVTALALYDLSQMGITLPVGVEGEFGLWLSGVPQRAGGINLFGPSPWSTNLYTSQRTIEVRGANRGGEVLASNAVGHLWADRPVTVPSPSGRHLVRVEPAPDRAISALWASFVPVPIVQRHYFTEEGRWVGSYAVYRERGQAETAKLSLWGAGGTQVPLDGEARRVEPYSPVRRGAEALRRVAHRSSEKRSY